MASFVVVVSFGVGFLGGGMGVVMFYLKKKIFFWGGDGKSVM